MAILTKQPMGEDMAKWRLKRGKKPTGGKIVRNSKKKRMQRGLVFAETKVGSLRKKRVERRGNISGILLFSAEKANVLDPRTGKTKQAKIVLVSQNPANPHYTRRNILTRGAIIKTELGQARVTNRPSREGVVNAVLE